MIEGFARTPSSRAHPALSRAYSPFPFNQVLWTLLLLVTREYVLSNIAVVELIFFLICGAVRQNNVNWPFVVVLVWFCCLRSRLRPAQLPRRLIFIVPFRSMTPRVAGTQGIHNKACKVIVNSCQIYYWDSYLLPKNLWVCTPENLSILFEERNWTIELGHN